MRTEGARLLSSTGLDHASIAAEVGISREAVTQWLSGDKRPSAARRLTLCKRYGVPVDAWDRPAGAPRAAVPGSVPVSQHAEGGVSTADEAPTGVGARFDAEARLRAQLARLDALRSTASEDLPPQVRMRLEATETRCIELLGKLTGEGQEIGESRIVRLPAWRRIQDAIVVALRPYPDAAVAVMAALKELGA